MQSTLNLCCNAIFKISSRNPSILLKVSAFNHCVINRKIHSKQLEDVHFFGFEKVSPSEKREKVQSVFSNVAAKYDLMNDVMSAGIHRIWKDYFIHTLSPTVGTKILDVAGGTGDIALRFLKAAATEDNGAFSDIQDQESHVTVLDINENMLSICKSRAKEAGVSNSLTCILGNAEIHRDEALLEAFRVLRPGGRFLCMEFSEVKNPTFNRIYHQYSHEIIPVLGELIAGDWKSYQYLVESIQKFPNQEEFAQMIKEAGFSIVTHENLFNGIAAIHSAFKL
ncbi:2-methoxy-6-polyprenyl-1,4-benzoquinol methylase, mitochondrial [Caerostris extrusa]|uniref:2-methoxy-6-polyprenyl-1,4-benzoquinol methylase, mitochondrial n=1 Tax=Caerostris extrusa TaxID=172846 RepID=A0AAV4NVA7_CAEEX|nr:2-methoxy-6-polyprenyl-1,4-benzoquinol methylase, mitochondrial [Caerostris extrusa]